MPPEEDCRQEEFAKYRNDGYISNVHPKSNSSFYNVLESLIDKLLPVFDRTIIDLKAPGYQNQRIHLVRFGRTPFIDREPENYRPPEQRAYGDFLNQRGQYKSSILVDLKREFWNIGVQMVLHVREINLSPSNPSYPSEEWHVQGQTVRSLSLTNFLSQRLSDIVVCVSLT